jgi:argonaute-like protein implicated in RNA metabolism and viral defense
MARGRPFPKGRSGNAGGRPKDTERLGEYARGFWKESVDKMVEIMRDAKAPANVRLAACEAILNRGCGKPAQAVHMTSEMPTSVHFIFDDE